MPTNGNRDLNGPRGELLRLLERLRSPMGLTGPAIRALVDQSEITYPGECLPLLTCSQRTYHVRFVVQGTAKIICGAPRSRHVIVDLVGKGEFLCVPPMAAAEPGHRIEVAVHDGPIVLALMPRDLVARVIGQLPPANAARLVSWSWRRVSRLLYAKVALLRLPTRERLIHELVRLARRFGRRRDDRWVLIDVQLTELDIASLIIRSRSNVSRAFAGLRKEGLVNHGAGRVLISASLVRSGLP